MKNPNARLEKFFTRSRANAGKKLPLQQADGSPSDEWLLVVGAESDAYIGALEDLNEELSSDKVSKATLVKLYARLVIDWSFAHGDDPVPCTHENVVMFLTESPGVAGEIAQLIRDRKSFFSPDRES